MDEAQIRKLLDHRPEFDTRAVLTLEALAPLSMVTEMPGKYYRSQPAPTREMLYGLLENALGWHLPATSRTELIRELEKRHKQRAHGSGVGYRSLLQFHLRWSTPFLPAVTHFDDLWCQHLRTESTPFVGGSREYDARAIPLMNALAARQVRVEDRAEAVKDPEALTAFAEGAKIHPKVLRPFFPQYYVSPTPREYVVPHDVYRFAVETSRSLAERIGVALLDPAAPLYLGSNDGWVEAEWRVLG